MAAVIDYPQTAFQPGYHVRFAEVDASVRHRDWYNSRYNSMLPANATIENGMAILDGGVINLPLLKLTSDFMAQVAWADGPTYSSDSDAVNEWLKENWHFISRAVERSVTYWSIDDVSVLVARPGTVEAFDPIFYFRGGNIESPDELVAHILAIRYTELTPSERLTIREYRQPNRIKVIKWFPKGRDMDGNEYAAYATEQVFEYHPDVVGEPLTPEMISDVTAICVAGGWDSWYNGIKDVAASVLINFSLQQQQLNRYANRAKYIPQSIREDIRNELGQGATAKQISDRWNTARYPIIALEGDKQVPPESIYEEDFESRHSFLDLVLEAYFLATGLPASSFGVGVTRNESGYAREKAQDAASARIGVWRRGMAECLPMVCRAMGCPEGNLSFNWSMPPFLNPEVKWTQLMAMYDRGLITEQEARRAAGWDDSAEAMQAVSQSREATQQAQAANQQRQGGN